MKVTQIATILNDFNSHAHVERDYAQQFVRDMVTNFNSHAHVERDPTIENDYHGSMDFNSHAHVERDGLRREFCKSFVLFQLTRSRGA